MRINKINGQSHILRVGCHGNERETHRVAAMRVNDVARIDAVSKRFRHLLSVSILNHRVNEHMLEGQTTKEVSIEHHHATHPQRDDFARGAEH